MVPVVFSNVRVACVELTVLVVIHEPVRPVAFGVVLVAVGAVGKEPVVRTGGVRAAARSTAAMQSLEEYCQ